MLYIKQHNPLTEISQSFSSAFEQGMKDAQVRKAFEDELVLRGFEMAPEGITPETAQKEGYQKTSFGFLRKKAPESSVEWLGKGGLGTGAPPGVATKTRGSITGFAPGPQEKDAWMTDLKTGAEFQAPRSKATDMLGLSPDRYARGKIPKPERLYETDEGFLARDQAIGKGKSKKETITNLKTGFEREVSLEVAKRLVEKGTHAYGKAEKTAKTTDTTQKQKNWEQEFARKSETERRKIIKDGISEYNKLDEYDRPDRKEFLDDYVKTVMEKEKGPEPGQEFIRTATNADGKKVGWDGNKWMPIQ